jgi:sugar phosphate isomerase/epimerase
MGTIHDTAASRWRIVSACPSPCLAAGLDFANLLIGRREEDLVEAARRFGPRLGYTHIKNVKLFPWGYDWNLPVRLGDINYFRVLKALKETGYRGPLAVEYCGTGARMFLSKKTPGTWPISRGGWEYNTGNRDHGCLSRKSKFEARR